MEIAQLVQLIAVLMVAGLAAGFAAGLFGIGGGFVVVPALLAVFTAFNVDPSVVTHVAIGTSLATIIVTSARSIHAHNKRGAVDFQVIRDWTPWLVIGAALGIALKSSVLRIKPKTRTSNQKGMKSLMDIIA